MTIVWEVYMLPAAMRRGFAYNLLGIVRRVLEIAVAFYGGEAVEKNGQYAKGFRDFLDAIARNEHKLHFMP
jgi:hypothetical protein